MHTATRSQKGDTEMKMNKKLISMIIVAILLITMLMPTSAFADGSDLEIPYEDCCMSYLIAQYDTRMA